LIFFLVGAGAMVCLNAHAERVYPFQGHLNVAEKSFLFSVHWDEGDLKIKVERNQDHSYGTVLDVEHLKTPFFDMTTQIQGVLDIHERDNKAIGLSGHFWSQYSLIDRKTVPEVSGKFDLNDGILRLDNFSWGGFRARASIDLNPPHQLEANLDFEEIGIGYFLDWLVPVGESNKFVGDGQLSGQIGLSGTPEKLMVNANINSQNGYIEDVAYDVMELHLQGVYPLIDVHNSTITKTNGFSFDLDGIVDLSDKQNMASQIKSIKKVPLINENSLQSEWILKSIQDEDRSGKTETKYFLKKNKGMNWPGQESSEVLGVEKKIGF